MSAINTPNDRHPGARPDERPHRLRNPMLQAAENARAVPASRRATRAGLPTGLAVAVPVLLGVGVLAGLWPAGNVVLLVWFETVVLFAVSVARIWTAERADPFRPVEIFSVPVGRAALTGVFALHYGGLSVLCLAWCGFVAVHVGWTPGLVTLGLPAALIVLRHLAELLSTWFGSDGQRRRLTVPQATTSAFPRLFVLVAAAMAAFAAVRIGLNGGATAQAWSETVGPLVAALPDAARPPGALVVLVLLALRLPLDVWLTRRAVTR